VVRAAKDAGANGFIIVDLPPEEALTFRDHCTKAGYVGNSINCLQVCYRLSYVPLVAPATSVARLKSLASIADSFIYVVSRMGVTGSSASAAMSASLPELCERVRKFAGSTPIAVGFGVNTREHFLSVGNLADGVVIGSKIVSLIKEAPSGTIENAIRAYCEEVSRPRALEEQNGVSHGIGLGEAIDNAKIDAISKPTGAISRPGNQINGPIDQIESLSKGIPTGKEGYEVFCLSLLHSDFTEASSSVRRVWGPVCPGVSLRLPCRA
jgi:tryptophan synthase